MTNAECCQLGCDSEAEFEIIDTRDNDPSTCFTLSCEVHVGNLLGHHVGAALAKGPDSWMINSLS